MAGNFKILTFIFCCTSISIASATNDCPEVVSKVKWGGRVSTELEYVIVPVKYVIVHHTVTDTCENENDCTDTVSSIQNFHMDELDFHDIGYNFLVGNDGRIYEGAGYHKVGAHTYGYNSRSLGLAFIGNFTNKLPNKKALNAAKKFLKCAIDLRVLDGSYKLLGARQVSATKSPGLKLYQELTRWDNFAKKP